MKISPKQYAQTLYDLTDGKSKVEIEKAVAGFARHIYKNRKLKLADKIIGQFSKIYNKQKNIIQAEAVSARELDKKTTGEIEKFIKNKYQAEKIELVSRVDKNLKGGVVLKVGDEVMDGSVRERLSELKKKITV